MAAFVGCRTPEPGRVAARCGAPGWPGRVRCRAARNPSGARRCQPASTGPRHNRPERAQRRRPDVVELEPDAALHEPAVVPEALAPVGVESQARWNASGAPSTVISPAASAFGRWVCMWARSGTVGPCSIARPPCDKSTTTRASLALGNVYRCTAAASRPTVSSAADARELSSDAGVVARARRVSSVSAP